jgi:Protein of unknown function (DUF742)
MSDDSQEIWFDQTPGSLIRPYAVTRGRTAHERPDLDMITMVVAVRPPDPLDRKDIEYREVLTLCASPQSIVEVSGQLRQPLFATKILVGDLIDSGHLAFRAPDRIQHEDNAIDLDVVNAILHHLKAL